jgi:hypothetical protein
MVFFFFLQKNKILSNNMENVVKERMETFLILPFYPIFAALKIK